MSPALHDRLIALLRTLPNDPTAIADFLHQRGIRGVPGDHTRCPLARWIAEPLGRTVSVTRTHCLIHQYSASVPLSPTQQDFVLRFDNHDYPNLLADE